MAPQFNPFTGDLQRRGAASAGGTVTSVGGGVGLTATPEPIVGAGTIDLDIFSLTTEAALAAGDWFPLVDVSVGTTPAAQRKVTLSNLAAGLNPLLDHGTLLGLIDDDHNIYLLLAGRAGTANNAILSTTQDGQLTGSTAALGGLNLRSNNLFNGTVTLHGATVDCKGPGGVGGTPVLFRIFNGDLSVFSSLECSPSQAVSLDYVLPPSALNGGFLKGGGGTGKVLSWSALVAGDIPAHDHGIHTGLTDDDHSVYLLLAGRTGSTNNPVLSTSTGGLISGSSASGQSIDIESTTHATKGHINVRDECNILTALTTMGAGNFVGLHGDSARSFTSDAFTFSLFAGNDVYNLDYVPAGTDQVAIFQDNSTINATTTSLGLPTQYKSFFGTPEFVAGNGVAVSGGTPIVMMDFQPLFSVAGSGTFDLINLIGLRVQPTFPSIASDVSNTTYTAVNVSTPLGVGYLQTTGINIESLTGTTQLSLVSAGTAAQMRHAGRAVFGVNAAPVANEFLRVRQSTIAVDVARFETNATNDDPVLIVRQGRAATTDATVTTLLSYTLTAAKAYLIEARVVAHRTGGAAGAADDSAAYIVYAGAKHTGGAAALITAVAQDYVDEDQAGWDATIDVNGNDVRVRVTGAANNNITWHCTLFVQEVGT